MVRGNAARGQTGYADCASKVTGKGTLLLSDLWPADMRNEAGIGGADVSVILPGLLQAQSTIDGTPDVPGILVFLAVVLPSAHRAQRQRIRGLERPVSAAWASIAGGLVLHHQDGRTLGAAGYGPVRSQA